MLERVSFNDNVFALLSSRDTGYFFKTFMTEPNWQPGMTLFVNNATQVDDIANEKMVTVTVRFQLFDLFDESESITYKKARNYEWRCYRAKDWSCSQTGIHQLAE
jgi:hypothetical protein